MYLRILHCLSNEERNNYSRVQEHIWVTLVHMIYVLNLLIGLGQKKHEIA